MVCTTFWMFERGEIKDVDISLSVTLDSNSVQEGKGHPQLAVLGFEAACEAPLAYPKGELRYSLP
ncbi:hypothetical protein Hanom_Chr06g00517411 [Helianthus anomalus]